MAVSFEQNKNQRAVPDQLPGEEPAQTGTDLHIVKKPFFPEVEKRLFFEKAMGAEPNVVLAFCILSEAFEADVADYAVWESAFISFIDRLLSTKPELQSAEYRRTLEQFREHALVGDFADVETEARLVDKTVYEPELEFVEDARVFTLQRFEQAMQENDFFLAYKWLAELHALQVPNYADRASWFVALVDEELEKPVDTLAEAYRDRLKKLEYRVLHGNFD